MQLAEGLLTGSERVALDRHLDGCAECSQLVGHLARFAAPARPAPPRYRVIRQIGAGAMGVVWEAEDTNLKRKVALKFVRPEGADNRALRKRLLREARALAAVRHPNVVSLFDAGEADDEVCLVLELIEGTNARVWGQTQQRRFDEVLGVWRQVAAGVAAVHRAGIIHRDIKPDNVFVADDGRVLVGDFGLATGDFGLTTTTNLTESNAAIGTPLYMAPEQLSEQPASTKSDQFALCASMWEAVMGERPYRGATIAAIVEAMMRPVTIPKDITGRRRRVLEVLARGLDPDPTKRFPDVDLLVVALDRAQVGDRPTSNLPWIIAGGSLLVAAAAVAAFLLTR